MQHQHLLRDLGAVAVTIGVALIAASCGENDGPSESVDVPALAKPIDACSLLTRAEAEATLGVELDDPTPIDFPAGGAYVVSGCGFTKLNPMNSVALYVRDKQSDGIVMSAEDRAAAMNKEFEKGRADPDLGVLAPKGDAQPLDGFGEDNAIWFAQDEYTLQVYIFENKSDKRSIWLSVTMDSKPSLQAASELAKKIASQVP